jgi:broad-specificity NMP kinase
LLVSRRVLLTGVSGVGKSTVIARLAAAGHRAVDLDEPEWSHEVAVDGDELTGIGPGRDWVWREDRVAELLDGVGDGTLFVAGTSPGQGRFYDRFDAVVLLSCDPALMAERLATRDGNPFGRDAAERERALAIRDEVEPLLRRGATHEIDTGASVDQVVGRVIAIGNGDAAAGG